MTKTSIIKNKPDTSGVALPVNPVGNGTFGARGPDRDPIHQANPMKISRQSFGDIVVLTICGVVDSKSAGPLYDTLVGQIRAGAQKLVVEFTDTVVLKRAGIRGIIVAAKILQNRRGQMRVCGAQPEHEQFLKSVSFRHLLAFDRDLSASIVAMAETGEAGDDGHPLMTPAKAA